MKIKLLNDLATVPTKGTKDSAGWDLYAALDCPITIDPNQTIVIPTAIAVEIPTIFPVPMVAASAVANAEKPCLFPETLKAIPFGTFLWIK